MKVYLMFLFVAGDYLQSIPDLSASDCKKYSCAPSTVSKQFSKSCVFSPSGSSQVYLWACSSTSTTNYCNTTSGSCQVPPPSNQLSYVGEPCTSTSDCYLSTCLKSTCRGLARDKPCRSQEQCDMGLRCDTRTLSCQPQIYVNETGCRSYYDCVNWATCNMTFNSHNGVCLPYHSVPTGKLVTDCVSGFSYLCESAYCTPNFSIGKLGICSDPPVSLNTMPKSCSTNFDCPGKVAGRNVNSNCVCGYNSIGFSYCSPFIGDFPGKRMLYSWKAALPLTSNCNTARRGSDKCLNMVGKLGNITQATLGYYFYSRYLANDDCVKLIYNYDYYYSGSVAVSLISSLFLF